MTCCDSPDNPVLATTVITVDTRPIDERSGQRRTMELCAACAERVQAAMDTAAKPN